MCVLVTAPPVDVAVDVPEQTIARKSATLDDIESDEDEPAAKYWRTGDFAAKASMDELAGSWLRDERGDGDEAWLDAQAEAEATEKALDNLLSNGVVEE